MQLASNETIIDNIAELICKARKDPLWFVHNVLNIRTTELDKMRGQSWDLDLWQEELVESVADVWRHKFGVKTKYNKKGLNKITIRAMHGPGKTFAVACLMHLFNFCFQGLIVCTGPKEKTLKTRLWPAFRKIRQRSSPAYRELIEVDNTKITWCGDEDWVAHIEAAASPENLAGYHEEYMLFVVDEASGVKEEMFPAIEGALSTGTVVIMILIGNPTKNSGTFYDSHCKERVYKNYHRIHVDLAKTTRVDPKWVKQMEEKYGKDSPMVAIRCYGNFADTDASQLIPLDLIIAANDKVFKTDGSIGRLRVSVDVADGGEDDTVITVARHYHSFVFIIKQSRHSFPATESPIMSAKAAIREFLDNGGNPLTGDDIVIDSLGVGAGTAGYVIDAKDEATGEYLNIPVVAYKGGEKSSDPSRWRNRRVQSYLAMNQYFHNGSIVFSETFLPESDFEDFCAQLCSVRRKLGGDRVDDLITKQQMKDEGIKSPDMADSLAMQFATQSPIQSTRLLNSMSAVGTMETSYNEVW